MRLLIISLILMCSSSSFSQIKEVNRYPNQIYIEDSANVFWTHYPNPFSPPTIIEPIDYDTVKTLNCYSPSTLLSTFYCDLSDTVLVAIQNESDSILYSAKVSSKSPPYFRYCVWVAGSLINHNELPNYYFQGSCKERLYIVLIVKGRKKCYKEIVISDNKYYWLNVN